MQFIHKYEHTNDSMGANFSVFFDPSATTRNSSQTVKGEDGKTTQRTASSVRGGDNAWIASILAGKPST